MWDWIADVCLLLALALYDVAVARMETACQEVETVFLNIS